MRAVDARWQQQAAYSVLVTPDAQVSTSIPPWLMSITGPGQPGPL